MAGAAGPSAAAATEDPEKLVKEAYQLKRSGKYDEAAQKLEAALKAQPSNAKAHWIFAWILAEQGTTYNDAAKVQRAKEEFQAFLKSSKEAKKVAEAKKALARLAKK